MERTAMDRTAIKEVIALLIHALTTFAHSALQILDLYAMVILVQPIQTVLLKTVLAASVQTTLSPYLLLHYSGGHIS
jgi:hypothetical protein